MLWHLVVEVGIVMILRCHEQATRDTFIRSSTTSSEATCPEARQAVKCLKLKKVIVIIHSHLQLSSDHSSRSLDRSLINFFFCKVFLVYFTVYIVTSGFFFRCTSVFFFIKSPENSIKVISEWACVCSRDRFERHLIPTCCRIHNTFMIKSIGLYVSDRIFAKH